MAYIKVDVTSDAFEGQYHTGPYSLWENQPVDVSFHSAYDPDDKQVDVMPACRRIGMYKIVMHCFFRNDDAQELAKDLSMKLNVVDKPGLFIDSSNWKPDKHMSSTWVMTSQDLYVSKPVELTLQVINKGLLDMEMLAFALHVQYLG